MEKQRAVPPPESESGSTESQFDVPRAASRLEDSESSGSSGSQVPTTLRPIPGRLGLAHSLLNFPSPHQLGKSTGIRKSKSLRIKPGPGSVATTSRALSPDVVKETLRRLGDEVGVEETDFAHPPAKKPKLQLSKAIITTHNGEPLKEFSLFLPSKLPAAIPNNASVLEEFVFKITATYLRLWNLAPHMDCVEIRLPTLYDEKFSGSSKFLKEFISLVFQQLNKVQSIVDLYVPKVELQATTSLDNIFAGMLGRATVSHLYLPLVSSLDQDEVLNYDFRSLAFFFHALNLEQLTIVSTDQVVADFCEELSKEVGCLHRCSVHVEHRNEELDPPGPDYIVCVSADAGVGEFIKPSEMVHSLNVYNIPRQYRREKYLPKKTRSVKAKAKGAFTSDCTYFDEAELTSESPFPSTIWNLDRLHGNGIDGTNTIIAIIDSGINYIHPTFKNKILAVRNFVHSKIDNIDCVIDSDGHGTHCAGLAAGCEFFCPTSTDPNSECIAIPPGVAPGAKLVICKVVKTTDGDVDSDAFIEALHWLKCMHVSGEQRIDVVSISLAATYYSHRQAQVISEMTGLGIIIVCCASNVGRLHLQPIAFPARLGQVLCIGAHDENGKPTSYSPVGRELDFLSPGDNLWGPGPGTKGPFAMDCASGTSCATPAVAGLICLILQAIAKICNSNPKKFEIGGKPLLELVHNVWVMRELLKVISSSPGHHSDEIGYGTLNPYRLLDRSDEEILRIVNDIVEDE